VGTRNRAVRSITVGYGIVMRSIPPIILLFLIFYGPQSAFPLLGWGQLPKPIFAVIAFTLMNSAYMAQVFRGAYLAVEKGQLEAALSIGLTPTQAHIKIIIPQALLIALPNMSSMMVMLVSETSLAYLIGVRDLMGEVITLNNLAHKAKTAELYFIVTMIYWGVNAVIERVFGRIERSLRQREGGVA
jgi:L-cystine transport system permease protein